MTAGTEPAEERREVIVQRCLLMTAKWYQLSNTKQTQHMHQLCRQILH